MEFKIDGDKILAEVIERDGGVHSKIKDAVTNNLIDNIYEEVKSKYIDNKWRGGEEISERVLDDLREKQTELVRDILKEFYNNYRYKKSDLAILKELKKFIEEE